MRKIFIFLIILNLISPKLEAFEIRNPLSIVWDFYGITSRLVEPEEIYIKLAQQAVIILVTQAALVGVKFKLNSYYPKIQNSISSLIKPSKETKNQRGLSKFNENLRNFVGFSFFNVFSGSFLDFFSNYQNQKLSREMEDLLNNKTFLSEDALKLSANNETRALAKYARKNIADSVQISSALLQSQLKTFFEAFLHVGYLYKMNSLRIIPYVALYELPLIFITDFISEKYQESSRLRYQKEVSAERISDDLINHAQKILTSDEGRLLLFEYRRLLQDKRLLEDNEVHWGIVLKNWSELHQAIDFAAKYYYLGTRISSGKLDVSNRYQVYDSSWMISNLFAWSKNNNKDFMRAELALKSTLKLLDVLDQINHEPCFEFSNEESPSFSIKLKNISFGYGERTLIQAEALNMVDGFYALTGPSGSGKSTFLKKLKGLIYSPGWAKGEIAFSGPNQPKISMVSQEFYIPPFSSIHQMLGGECELLEKDLDQYQDDWANVLSGGEKKKLALCAGINQRPDILILDEVFNGMDHKSIQKAQDYIRENMKGKIVLSVDHEFSSHQKNKFYDGRIKFKDGEMTLFQI